MTTRVGLLFPPDLSLDDWTAAGQKLYGIAEMASWCLGDWLAYGQLRLSGRYQRAADRVGLDNAQACPYGTVPYFWSDWYSSRIQFVGISAADSGPASVELVAGALTEGGPFTALYRAQDRIIGALAVDMPAEVMKYRRLIRQRTGWDAALKLAEARRLSGR